MGLIYLTLTNYQNFLLFQSYIILQLDKIKATQFKDLQMNTKELQHLLKALIQTFNEAFVAHQMMFKLERIDTVIINQKPENLKRYGI
jgi:hypothetical protein